jgi:uncharacterized protein YhaN
VRIARLDLTRYGRFSDYSIDFGSAPSDGPDFHVVYGLNEAGKSTAAAAILDLLFGIEKQSPYGAAEARTNWHAFNAMRIGARLEIGGAPHELARLKRDKNSLVDKDNRAIDETFLKGELAGVDRAAFRMMFSLDDESLEKGGEAILASRGDLGQLLFSASAGVAEFSGRLDALRKKTEEFFRPRASKTELAEKKRELDGLKAERDKADTLASTYAELVRQRDEAQAAYEAAAKALAERRARADAIQRLLAALPHLAALREAEAGLGPLAKLPAPPAGASDEAARLQADAIKLATRKESSESAVKGLEEELETVEADPAALEVACRVDAWRDLRSRYDTAKDIPTRRGELDAKRAIVADILRRLGREREAEPRKLLLAIRAVGALEDFIAARSGVETKLAGAREALAGANEELANALAEAVPSECDRAAIEVLKKRLQAARRDDSEPRLRDMRAQMEKQGRRLREAIAALAPWCGEPEALALVAVPGEAETAALRQRLSQAREARQRQFDRFAAKTGEAERLKAETTAAARAAELVGDEAAAALRAERESAWSAHRSALTAASADAFEAAMRCDDSAGAARFANARELATARERARTLAGVEVEAARAKTDLEAAEKALQALDCEIAAAMPATPPVGRDPLAFLDAWRSRRDEALALMEALRGLKDDMRRLAEDAARTRDSVSEALRAAGVAHDAQAGLEPLIDAAEAALGEAAEAETRRQRIKERRSHVTRAEAKLKAAVEEEAAWRTEWRQACAGSWLAEGDVEPRVGAVREALKALGELRAALKDCAELEHRIDAMERDKRLFAGEVGEVAALLGLEPADDAARLADAIASRVAEARQNQRRQEEKAKALAAARAKQAAIAEEMKVNAGLALAMTRLFGVETLAEVMTKLEDCRRRDRLRDDVDRETRAILASNLANSFDAARAALENADRAALEQELSDIKIRAQADDSANAETFAAYREASRRLEAIGGDEKVVRIEEKRRTILEEIKDGARRYLMLRAGVAAADEALRLYRDRHRGAMMERASKAFTEISRGAYKGLTTEPNGASETLIALPAEGGSKTAEQLSKGARFQLYLALRLAGYHELARTRPPAPFVADDIMETFDHFRAEEALKLFADMGRVGQVIYLTHHLHLAEIAKRVCPEARLHELAS